MRVNKKILYLLINYGVHAIAELGSSSSYDGIKKIMFINNSEALN